MSREGADRSLTKILGAGFFSLGAAYLGSSLGDGLAEVSGNSDTFLGVGFQASGFIGGFVLIFLLLTRTLSAFERRASEERRWARPFTVALKCRGTPQGFSKGDRYEATYSVTNLEHKTKEGSGQPRWAENLLVIDIPEVHFHDRIDAKLTNEEGIEWVVSGFNIREPVRDADTRPVAAVSRWARSQQLPRQSDFVVREAPLTPNPVATDLRGELLEGPRGAVGSRSPLRPIVVDQRNSTMRPRLPSYGHVSTDRRGSHHG